MIRISPLLRGLKVGGKSISVNNIETRLGFQSGSVRPEDLPQFKDLQSTHSHTVDQINYINEALADEKLAPEISDADLNGVLTGSPDVIKQIYTKVDDNRRSLEISERFKQNGNFKDNVRGVKNYFKDVLRNVENRANHSYMITESNILKNVFKGLDDVQQSEAKQAFDWLLNSPEKFVETYGVSQDTVNRAILGEVDETVSNSKILTNIVKAFQTFDDEVIGYAQELGVPIGQLDDFFLPFRVPKDTPYILGEAPLKQLILKTTTLDEKGVDYLVEQLVKRADDTSSNTNISFGARDIQFRSTQDELDFYRAINQIDAREPLLPYLMLYKKQLLRKVSVVAGFGNNPTGVINKTINRLVKGGDKEAAEQASKLKDDVKDLIDAYEGKLRVTSKGVENFRRGFSQAVSATTGATGVSFTRNLFTDFNWNGAAASQAVYNPNYTLGDAAMGMLKDFGFVIQTAFKTNKVFREHMSDLLAIMEIANSSDSFTHASLLNFEDIFDLSGAPNNKTFGDKVVNGLMRFNNNIYTYSGQHALIDFRRFRQMISLQQMWTKNLENFSHKQWAESLDDIGQKQLKHLETTYNLGEREFDFLREAIKIPFEHNGRNLGLITRDSILDTSDDIAKKFLKKGETVEHFKRRVANGWQSLIYANLNEATPVPMTADSISAGLRNYNSWMRFLSSIPLKFGDIAQSQWQGVADRIALATYGDKSKYIGADRSLLKYGQALGVYTGSAIGVQWANDLLRGRKLTDMTDLRNVGRALSGSGFGGFATMAASGFLNLYPSQYSGTFATAPAGVYPKEILKIIDSVKNDDSDLMWYKISKFLTKASGYGNIWFLRGILDEMLRSAILKPTTKREYELRRDNARRTINR